MTTRVETTRRASRFASASAALALLAGATTLLASATNAQAAGLYFSDRGVRPLARGGAFVAGADDLGAIYYNPAGLVDAKSQILVDASWMQFGSTFQRQVAVTANDPNTGAAGASSIRTFDKVNGTTPVLPLPTIAASYAIRPDVVVAIGTYAPYAALTSYPETVNGKPSPQRYSLLTLNGSALINLGAWVAWRPTPWLQVGGGPTVLVGKFQTSVTFGACVPDRFACAPEQPEYDAAGQLSVGTIVSPSGTFGVTVIPHDMVRVGVSYQLGNHIDAPATLKTRLPAASFFDQARVDGDQARVKFDLPWILRTGVEIRPAKNTRVEASWVFEKWSVHDKIDVVPQNVTLRNVALIGDYRVGNLSIQRGFQDAWSLHLGGEQTVEVSSYLIDIRAGLAYEKSAVPKQNLSVLTVDLDKVTVGMGGGLHIGKKWRLDGTFALVFATSADVSPAEAKITKVNPLRALVPAGSEAPINAGKYTAHANVMGVGVRYLFE